jgi:hypothetical protein
VGLAAILMLLSAVAGCSSAGLTEPSGSTLPAEPSGGVATALVTEVAPTLEPSIPTDASPAPTPPQALPSETVDTVSAEAGLVLHLTTASDVGAYGPGTTILEDRRIIWGDKRARPLESRLSREAFADVLAAIDATNAFDRDGHFFPELRPGKQPPGHGLAFHLFELVRDGKRIGVSAADPASFAGEENIWRIPPEMGVLTDLAHRLVDPLAWLGADAFTEPIRPYQAKAFLVEIHLYRGFGGAIPNVDAVRWPFGEPIERVGVPFEAGGDPESRCLLIDAATASRTVEAERSAGVERDLRDWSMPLDYEWPRVGGFVTVTLTHLLPYESGTCVELATTLP